jgi:hypothetical protein
LSCQGCEYSEATCSILTEPTGSFSDGSGDGDYIDFSDCSWIISPHGASQITIAFPEFSTEEYWDMVTVYSCFDVGCDSAEVVDVLTGNYEEIRIVEVLSGIAKVSFYSDGSVTAPGFTLTWAADGQDLVIPDVSAPPSHVL